MGNELEPPASGKAPGSNARFWRFSTSQLLLLVTALAVLCALYSRKFIERHKEQRQEAEIARIIATFNSMEDAFKANDHVRARQILELGNPEQILAGRQNDWANQCAVNGQLPMLTIFLQYGVEPPSFAAVIESKQPREVRRAVAQVLIAAGSDPSDPEAWDTAVREYDCDSAELLRELGATFGPRELAAFNRLDELKMQVYDRPEILQQRFRRLWAGEEPTLLAIALAGGYREMSLFLIESGAPLDMVVYCQQTMLHMAAKGGDPELIRLVAARGLDVNARDSYQDTPLSDISYTGKSEAVTTLLELGADVNTQGLSKRTPLYRAVDGNRLDLARILLAAGADPQIPALTKQGINDWHEESTIELAKRACPEFLTLLDKMKISVGGDTHEQVGIGNPYSHKSKRLRAE